MRGEQHVREVVVRSTWHKTIHWTRNTDAIVLKVRRVQPGKPVIQASSDARTRWLKRTTRKGEPLTPALSADTARHTHPRGTTHCECCVGRGGIKIKRDRTDRNGHFLHRGVRGHLMLPWVYYHEWEAGGSANKYLRACVRAYRSRRQRRWRCRAAGQPPTSRLSGAICSGVFPVTTKLERVKCREPWYTYESDKVQQPMIGSGSVTREFMSLLVCRQTPRREPRRSAKAPHTLILFYKAQSHKWDHIPVRTPGRDHPLRQS